MSLASRARQLVRRFTTSALATAQPFAPPAQAQGADRPAKSAEAPPDNRFVRKNLDWERLARDSATRFERVYYGHRGRVMFKWAHYLPIYDQLLLPFVGKPITLVEIGLAQGGSLQLWREYLGPQVRIVGVDLDPRCKAFEAPGVEVLIGDQADPAFLETVARTVGTAEVVIDDGSHINAHQILTFETLFPIVMEGGVYVCEDLHTSYWPDYGGGLGREDTFIGYAKQLIDKLHFKYGVADLPEEDLSRWIGAMVVADSLIGFQKAAPRDVFMAWVGRDHRSSTP